MGGVGGDGSDDDDHYRNHHTAGSSSCGDKGKSSPNKLVSQQALWKFLQVQPRKITSDSQKWDCGEAVRNYISMRLKDEFEVSI